MPSIEQWSRIIAHYQEMINKMKSQIKLHTGLNYSKSDHTKYTVPMLMTIIYK